MTARSKKPPPPLLIEIRIGNPIEALFLNTELADSILQEYRHALGHDFETYRNHVIRVLAFYQGLRREQPLDEAVAIAAVFHDLGIWTAGSLDYLEPSVQLAKDYLGKNNRSPNIPLVQCIILSHHRLRSVVGEDPRIEAFRQADGIDVSAGLLSYGLARSHIRAIQKAYPHAGFHRWLFRRALTYGLCHPLRPLPMLKWK